MAEVEIIQVKPKRGRPRSERKVTFKDWYEQNKKALSDKRKERYHSDPEYRNKVIAMNRDRRKRLRDEASQVDTSAKRQRGPVEADVEIGGQTVRRTMYFVGHMATAIGRSVQTIHSWEKRGAFPKTPYKHMSPKQERLYTSEMIDAVRDVTAVTTESESMRIAILARWKELGVVCPE